MNVKPVLKTARPLRLAAVASLAVMSLWAPVAAADHAGETVTVSKTTDLAEGETVTVRFSGFTFGGDKARVVTAGQGKLTTVPDKLNFDEYANAPTVDVGPDGTGSFEYVVVSDHGTTPSGAALNCKVEQCWIIVVQTPFRPQPNYASVPITFAGGSVAASETTTAPTTAASPAAEAPAQTTTTAAPATTTTAVMAEATTTTVKTAEAASSKSSSTKDSGGSGALYAIIAAVVVLLGAGGFAIARKKPPVS
jgi:hypothetical protein